MRSIFRRESAAPGRPSYGARIPFSPRQRDGHGRCEAPRCAMRTLFWSSLAGRGRLGFSCRRQSTQRSSPKPAEACAVSPAASARARPRDKHPEMLRTVDHLAAECAAPDRSCALDVISLNVRGQLMRHQHHPRNHRFASTHRHSGVGTRYDNITLTTSQQRSCSFAIFTAIRRGSSR